MSTYEPMSNEQAEHEAAYWDAVGRGELPMPTGWHKVPPGQTWTTTFPRQWQVRLNIAGWWGAWCSVEASDADGAFEAACDQYVLDGTDSRLMDHVNESRIVETK